MSRRKLQWRKQITQAGGEVDKVIPTLSRGQGTYLTKMKIEGVSNERPRRTGDGDVCTKPISPRKESLVRQWAK
jgi:hypothetical protein